MLRVHYSRTRITPQKRITSYEIISTNEFIGKTGLNKLPN